MDGNSLNGGKASGFRRSLLGTLWQAGAAAAILALILLMVAPLEPWPWVLVPVTWLVQSLLTGLMLGAHHSRIAAWIYVVLSGVSLCIPPVLSFGRPAASSLDEVLLKAIPFGFLVPVLLSQILLHRWSVLALLAMQAMALVAYPLLSNQTPDPLHLAAVGITAAGGGVVWVSVGRLLGTIERALKGCRLADEQAKELVYHRNELQKNLLVQDALRTRMGDAEIELRGATAQLEVVADVCSALNSSDELDKALSSVVDIVHDRLELGANLFLYDKDTGWATLRSTCGSSLSEAGHRLAIDERTVVGWSIAHGEVRSVVDVQSADVFLDPIVSDARWEAAFPLLSSVGVLGALHVHSDRPGGYSEREGATLTMISARIGGAVALAQAMAQQEQSQQLLARLQSRYSSESWQRFGPQLEAMGYRWETGSVTPLTHRPLPQVTQACSSRETVVGSEGLVTPIVTPGGQAIGALGLHDPDPSRRWTETDVALVESVANQAAMALENARLYRDAQDRLAEITALHRRYLRQEYSEFVPGLPRVEYAFAQPGIAPEVTLDEHIELVLSEKRPVTTVEEQGAVPQSSVLAPIALREYVLGVLGLEEVGEEREWDEDELAIIDAVTEHMSLAIENARLFRQTEQRAVELARVAEELRETDRFRSQFLANMSHELRTPLNAIIGFSRVILKGIDGPLTDLQKTDLEAIYNNGQHLLQMINDILDMSKIEAGRMELIVESVDINALVGGIVSSSAALIQDPNVEFRTQIEPNLPIVRADGTRIRQVITNLVSNAAKFTYRGLIELRVWAEEDMLYVSVSDTGEGIPEDKLPLVFEPFRQVDSSPTRQAQGTGLGLPISRQFVEMHGGRIWLESQVGVGSTFTFCIPIEGPVEQVPELTDLEIDESKRLLLLLGGEQNELSTYNHVLEGDGYQVVPLYQNRDAVRWARYLRPWAILMEVQLDGKPSWEALESLKSSRATRDVPVIVCAAAEGGGQAISLGASAFLPKPLGRRQVLEILGRLER